MNEQSEKNSGTRTIIYCRSDKRDNLHQQEEKILSYAKAQGYTVTETFMESGTMGPLTYHGLRLRAKYREFDILLVKCFGSIKSVVKKNMAIVRIGLFSEERNRCPTKQSGDD